MFLDEIKGFREGYEVCKSYLFRANYFKDISSLMVPNFGGTKLEFVHFTGSDAEERSVQAYRFLTNCEGRRTVGASAKFRPCRAV
jgi:hypothetical protein